MRGNQTQNKNLRSVLLLKNCMKHIPVRCQLVANMNTKKKMKKVTK